MTEMYELPCDRIFLASCGEKWLNRLASEVVVSKGLLGFESIIIFSTTSPFDCIDCVFILTC